MPTRLDNLSSTMESQQHQSKSVNATFFDYAVLVGEGVRSKAYELELRDITGNKSLFNIAHSMQLMMLMSNYGLASNHDIRKSASISDMPKSSRKEGTFIASQLSRLSNNGIDISHGKMFKALFVDSLPDVFTGLREATPAQVPSAIMTAIVNGALNVFVHVPLQAVQALMQVLSMPTVLTNYCYNKAKPPQNVLSKKANTEYSQLNKGWLLLAGATAIVLLPLQLFSIAANTIGHARHVIDSAATMSKALVNFVLDSVSIVVAKRGRVNTKDFEESVQKASGQLSFAFKDLCRNLYKLAPIVLTGVLAFFSGGLTVVASSLGSTVAAPLAMPLAVLVVSPLLAIASQAMSALQIAIPKIPLVSKVLKSVSSWFFESKKETSVELVSFKTNNKHSSMPDLGSVSPALSTLSQGEHPYAMKNGKGKPALKEETMPLMVEENSIRSSVPIVEAKAPITEANPSNEETDTLLKERGNEDENDGIRQIFHH